MNTNRKEDEEDREEWLAKARLKTIARMEEIDRQPPAIRALVHEYNWNVVRAFIQCGVTNPRHIKHLIMASLAGAAAYGVGRPQKDGIPISTTLALEIMHRPDLALVQREPTEEMLQASMGAVEPYRQGSDAPLLSKREKHLRRLRAAIAAGMI